MKRIRWTERKFVFDHSPEYFGVMMERLRGTSARLKEMMADLTEQESGQKSGINWSIKEHIGHLSDLEELHALRIDDFLNTAKELQSADMSNTATTAAEHHKKSILKLLNDFTIRRRYLVKRFLMLDEEKLMIRSVHPRLQQEMTPIDMAYFIAEHDDHHLASMRELIEKL